jgi:hypothetical protein
MIRSITERPAPHANRRLDESWTTPCIVTIVWAWIACLAVVLVAG